MNIPFPFPQQIFELVSRDSSWSPVALKRAHSSVSHVGTTLHRFIIVGFSVEALAKKIYLPADLLDSTCRCALIALKIYNYLKVSCIISVLSTLSFCHPALSPVSVICSGLPPNFRMFLLTHCNAISWSLRPIFALITLSPCLETLNAEKFLYSYMQWPAFYR